MSSAAIIRIQVESALASKIPSPLTPAPKWIRPVVATGIKTVDELLEGGLPVGAITELVGPECSGRTSMALSFLANVTQAAKVCAWIDVSDTLHPESAASAGMDLARLLWVRCGVVANKPPQSSHSDFRLPEKYLVAPPTKRGLHGGGFGPHPRGEVKGLSEAIGGLLTQEALAPRCAEPQRRVPIQRKRFEPAPLLPMKRHYKSFAAVKPWSRIEQALRVTDLLLQGGGFSAIVLDMGGIAPEYVSRVPLATWFRYRAAAEKTQASILLLTQYACAKSSAELVLQLKSGDVRRDEATVFSGMHRHVAVSRQRFTQASSNIIPLRKPPQRATCAIWESRTSWMGRQ